MDTDVIPLGERVWRSILDHVIAVGDEAEANYLEVKGSLDLTAAVGVVKVAKFLLGVANRLPRDAVRHFHGYAVLVIGARKGEAPGIPRGIEPHELEDRLRPYLGPQFPSFESGRITVDEDHEVLFVIAEPPQDGQTIFPCHKSYQGAKHVDNLDDGAVYVRGPSNTRPARSGEILALVERARGVGKAPISLDIEVFGSISGVERVDEVLTGLYAFEEEKFVKHKSAAGDVLSSAMLPVSILGKTAQMAVEERERRLAQWRSDRAENISKGRAYFLGVALGGVGIRVTSRDRFVSKPQLIVTFHDCEAFAHRDVDDADWSKVIEPIVKDQNPYGLGFVDPANFRIRPLRQHPVNWGNHNTDAVITLAPESFRPNVPWSSGQDDYVLLTRDPRAETVTVTWVLTEDSNDAATTGELQLAVAAAEDAGELFETTFLDNT